MIPHGKFKILAVDMSLRDAGVCVFEKQNNRTIIHEALSLKTIKEDTKFRALECDALQLNRTMMKIKELEDVYAPAVILVEFPSFSQQASAGIAIGMVWGAWAPYFSMPNFAAIEPSALKIWSGSKKGDAKTKVKEQVLVRVPVLSAKQTSNNNIVDAVGIALMFCDLIHELSNAKTNPKSSSDSAFRLNP